MKTTVRPRLEGTPATLRQKLGAMIAGKPLHLPGEIAYHREDFADVFKASARDAPLAMARRMSRLFQTDHDKLDKLTNKDSLFNEMDYDAVCGGAKQRYEEALAAARLSIEVPDEYRDYCASVTRPGTPLLEDSRTRTVDAEMRGFVLGEVAIERIERGQFAGYDTIGSIRRVEGDAYRLEEDEFSRPAKLELWVTDTAAYQRQQITGQSRYIGGSMRPQQQVVLLPGDADWDRYQFLTWPERASRVAGLPRYGMAFPWYFFATHLRQWMMTLAERTGTPIIVAEFNQTGELLGDKYAITNEEMFGILEKIQTNFRGLVPSGYSLKALATGAEGLAQLLQMLYTTCRSMCEVAILGEEVSSGANASVGTAGANQTIIQTTFGAHVASGHKRQGRLLSRSLEYLIQLNFGVKVDVECSFEPVDPVKQAAKITNAEKAIGLGIASRYEPHLRELFDLPPADDALLQATQAAASDAARYGLGDVTVTETPAQVADTDKVLEIIDRVQDGDIGDALAATMLAKTLGVSAEEAARVVAEEKARRLPAGSALPVAAAAAGTGGPETVQDLALNGAQVVSLQGMLAAVGIGEIAPEAAVLSILTAFPSVPEARARAMVTAQAALPKAQPEPAPAQTFSDAAMIASHRMRGAMGALRKHISARYDTDRPPPISDSLSMAMGAFCGLANRAERERRAAILRGRIADSLRVGLAGSATDEEALARFADIEAHYTDPETLMEFADGALPA